MLTNQFNFSLTIASLIGKFSLDIKFIYISNFLLIIFWMAKQFNLKSCKHSLKATRKTSWSLQLSDSYIITLKRTVGTVQQHSQYDPRKNRHSSSTTFHICVFAATFPRKDWSLLRHRTQAEPYVNAVLLPKKAAFIFGKMKSQISFVIVRCKFLLWKKTTFIDAEKISTEFCSSTPRNKKLIWTLQLKSFVWIYKNVTALSLFK